MKSSERYLSDMSKAQTTGEARQVAANAMMALARGEISATEAAAVSRQLDAITKRLDSNAEKMKAELSQKK